MSIAASYKPPVRPSSRAGRPRDPQIEPAVLDATLAALDGSGHNRLTLEEVARRAGTTKPAVYGRRLGEIRVPDTDCTLCDLAECGIVFVAAFRRMPPDALGSLLADCAGDPALRTAFMATLFRPPRVAVEQTLVRAVEHGDLRRDLDLGLALDLLGSVVYYRALFEHAPITDAEIEGAVETLLRGVATDYLALQARARDHPGGRVPHPPSAGRTVSR